MTHHTEGRLCHLPGGALGLTQPFPVPATPPTISDLIWDTFLCQLSLLVWTPAQIPVKC